MADTALENPTSKFPKPPFKRQTQPWPGLAGQMEPRPDHGEKSYRGSGRLAGRKALITGGDFGMGRAAAIAYAREGADVAINYFPSEEPDAQEVIGLIKAEGRIGLAIPGDLRDEKFCQELVARAREGLGGLDIIVNNAARQQSRGSDDLRAVAKPAAGYVIVGYLNDIDRTHRPPFGRSFRGPPARAPGALPVKLFLLAIFSSFSVKPRPVG